MKYKNGDIVTYKKYTAIIRFCYPDYKNGKDAYAIHYIRKNGSILERVCFEDELSPNPDGYMQLSLFDIPY